MHHTYFAFTKPVQAIYPLEVLDDDIDENQKQLELNMTQLREDFLEMTVEEMNELIQENNELMMLIYRQEEEKRRTRVSQSVCWTIVGYWPRDN
jgi:Ser-tRNA(Ala) deacylase AlaX